MKVAVVGTGYVGLVSGLCFAEMGHTVTCIDSDSRKIATLRKGNTPIYEPGIEDLLKKHIQTSNIAFTNSLKDGVSSAKVIFLALPTPPNEDGSADLRYVLGVAAEIGALINDYVVIVNKSTVPVGTAKKVRHVIQQNTKSSFDVVSNPEFLREGHAIRDFMEPDRIVIGADNETSHKIIRELYLPLAHSTEIIEMDVESAELTKYAANAFLALKITYANEIANLCEKLGADIDLVKKGIGTDSRIGSKFLNPGIGYGGSCFPKDTTALLKIAEEVGGTVKTIETAVQVNQSQKNRVVEKLITKFDGSVRGRKIAVWGLAFKPDTDDVREAPAEIVISELIKMGARIVAYDPEARDTFSRLIKQSNSFKIVDSAAKALENADALVICTEWPEFASIEHSEFKKMKHQIVIDGRNIFELKSIPKGMYYESIGRKVVHEVK